MIESIKARLAGFPGVALIGGAAGFAQASEVNPPAVPALYVLRLNESPSDNALTNGVEQRVEVVVGVVICTRNAADPQGEAASADIESLRPALRARLLGWLPDGCTDPLTVAPAGLLAVRDGYVWWQDQYKTAYYERTAS